MRVLTGYVSAFQRARIHGGRFVRGESFVLSANFNGALASGATIASVEWRVTNPQAVIFGTAAKTDRASSVECTAGYGGAAMVKAIATASDGAVFTQLFHIRVQAHPFFQGETAPASGSTLVTA